MIPKKRLGLLLFIFSVCFIVTNLSYAHCQLPCGIYDDQLKIQVMLEDVSTIEKADDMIDKLAAKKDPQSQNQLVRWIMNKEEYSQKIISTITDYFLTQRVKPDQKDYTERLIKHHAVIIAAMKTKQNVDHKYAIQLRKKIEDIALYYDTHNHVH